MITEKQYKEASEQKKRAGIIIDQYFKERAIAFQKRLKEGPVFTDDELYYSATARCPCGHGLAYPKECGAGHYWDCSAILKGVADKNIQHTDQLPFSFYDVKGESDYHGSTRPDKNQGS